MVYSAKLADNKIDVKKLAVGTYILLLKDIDGKSYSQKFMKK
jgi:hypothetical protein